MDVSKRQTEKAVRALLKHLATENAGQVQRIYLQITINNPLVSQKQHIPVLIKLPSRFVKTTSLSICLIVKDPQQAATDVLNDDKAATADLFKEIISISKLKSRLKSKKELDKFSKSYDMILADSRVIDLLPTILGSSFYKSGKNMPVPIRLAILDESIMKAERKVLEDKIDPKAVKYQVKSITKSAALAIVPGTCLSLCIGTSEMVDSDLITNINHAINELVAKVLKKNGMSNVKGIHIKSPTSASLPVLES